MERKLTKKEKFFIAEYQKVWIGSQAVIRAGYRAKNNQIAAEIACELLKKTEVKEAIERGMNERLQALGIRAERVLQEIARIGFADLGRLFRADGTMWPIQDLDEDTRAALASVQTFEEFPGRGEDRMLVGHTRKIKLFDKLKALELLGKYLKIFPQGDQKVDADVNVKGRQEVMNPLQMATKILYLIELAKKRQKELEEAKKLEGG